MPQVVSAAPPQGQSLHLSDVDWRTYTRLLRVFADRPGTRLTYDRGELEIISPSLEHDDDGRLLGFLVFVLTEELGLPLKPGGSVTMRRKRLRKGVEADECFWIANAHRLAGRRRLDLRTDPPPDLVIEVDVTRSSLDRVAIYAALGVPEVWRLEGDVLAFFVLGPNGSYESASHSRAFPFLTPADLITVLLQARDAGDQNPAIRGFREWVREHRKETPPDQPQ